MARWCSVLWMYFYFSSQSDFLRKKGICCQAQDGTVCTVTPALLQMALRPETPTPSPLLCSQSTCALTCLLCLVPCVSKVNNGLLVTAPPLKLCPKCTFCLFLPPRSQTGLKIYLIWPMLLNFCVWGELRIQLKGRVHA